MDKMTDSRAAEAQAQGGGEVNPWQLAVDQARVTAHLGIAADGVSKEEAVKQLGELIDFHIAIATDPAVNGGFHLTPVAAPPSAPVGVEAVAAKIGVRYGQNESCKIGVPFYSFTAKELRRFAAALAQQPAAVDGALSRDELDLCRQWFDSVQDTNGGYLSPPDYVLAAKLYRALGMRVPQSISRIAAQPGGDCHG